MSIGWQRCLCERSEGVSDDAGPPYCATCGGHSPNQITQTFFHVDKDKLDRCLHAMQKLHREAGENEFGGSHTALDEDWPEVFD